MKVYTLVIALVLCCSSCYYNSEEGLYGSAPCDTSNVRYSVQIIGILSANCFVCHGGDAANGGGNRLSDFTVLQSLALNGHLLASVNHEPGHIPMPKNAAKLPDCQIAQIRTWIRNGAPAN